MRWKRSVALLLIASITACYGPPTPIASPRDYLKANQPTRVWVRNTDGSIVQVRAPRLFGDTLSGRSTSGPDEVWIPLNSGAQLQVRQIDRLRTSLLVGGVVVGAAVFLALFASRSTGGQPYTQPNNGYY